MGGRVVCRAEGGRVCRQQALEVNGICWRNIRFKFSISENCSKNRFENAQRESLVYGRADPYVTVPRMHCLIPCLIFNEDFDVFADLTHSDNS